MKTVQFVRYVAASRLKSFSLYEFYELNLVPRKTWSVAVDDSELYVTNQGVVHWFVIFVLIRHESAGNVTLAYKMILAVIQGIFPELSNLFFWSFWNLFWQYLKSRYWKDYRCEENSTLRTRPKNLLVWSLKDCDFTMWSLFIP